MTSYDVTYTYDAVGNRLTMVDDGQTTTYTYDMANELLLAESPSGITTYSYDAEGNRTQKDSSTSLTAYSWDENNRLIEAQPVAGDITFQYNADGQRTEKKTANGTTRFIYDFRRLLQETDGVGDPDKQYTFLSDEYGDLVSEYDGVNGSRHHLYDAQRSTAALLDGDENITDRYKYRAFGIQKEHAGLADSPLTFVGMQGYYHDSELDLYLLGAGNSSGGGRYYDAADGRFMSEDPLRFDSDDTNLFRFVANNPVNSIDPSGQAAKCEADCTATCRDRRFLRRFLCTGNLRPYRTAIQLLFRHSRVTRLRRGFGYWRARIINLYSTCSRGALEAAYCSPTCKSPHCTTPPSATPARPAPPADGSHSSPPSDGPTCCPPLGPPAFPKTPSPLPGSGIGGGEGGGESSSTSLDSGSIIPDLASAARDLARKLREWRESQQTSESGEVPTDGSGEAYRPPRTGRIAPPPTLRFEDEIKNLADTIIRIYDNFPWLSAFVVSPGGALVAGAILAPTAAVARIIRGAIYHRQKGLSYYNEANEDALQLEEGNITADEAMERRAERLKKSCLNDLLMGFIELYQEVILTLLFAAALEGSAADDAARAGDDAGDAGRSGDAPPSGEGGPGGGSPSGGGGPQVEFRRSHRRQVVVV